MPTPSKQFPDYLPNLGDPGSFFFNPASPLEIENEIMSTPLNKAHGLYFFPEIGKIYYKPTSINMNRLIENGIYASKLKLA